MGYTTLLEYRLFSCYNRYTVNQNCEKKISDVIGYHQPNLSIMLVNGQFNRTVNMSCLCNWTEHVMCTCCCFEFCRVTFAIFYENV